MRAKVEAIVRDCRIVAIIRGHAPEVCLRLAEAYAKGGIRAVEVTFVQTETSPWKSTTDAISAIAGRFGDDLCVGAGTVLTREQLELTVQAGGQFMVAPNVNVELIRECAKRDLASMPGAFTATEAVTAWEAGASFVKMFPAGTLGPGYIKALKAPLAQIPMLAVGGVTPDNVADFIKAGCVGVAVSGALTDRKLIAEGAWDKITEVAKVLVERAHT